MKELEQFDFDIQKLLEPLEAEIQQGVNLKEEDFNKDMVNWLWWKYEWTGNRNGINAWTEIRNLCTFILVLRQLKHIAILLSCYKIEALYLVLIV